MDHHGQQQPQDIYYNMAFAPGGLLMDIHPSGFAAFGSFHTLAVDNGGTGLRVASGLLPGSLDEHGVELLPQPAVRPPPEVAVHGLPGREVAGQHAPLTARAGNVENGVENQPRCPFTRSAPVVRLRKEVHQLCPFLSSEVRRVSLSESYHPSSLPNHFQNTL
jgi:hypothetical protein